MLVCSRSNLSNCGQVEPRWLLERYCRCTSVYNVRCLHFLSAAEPKQIPTLLRPTGVAFTSSPWDRLLCRPELRLPLCMERPGRSGHPCHPSGQGNSCTTSKGALQWTLLLQQTFHTVMFSKFPFKNVSVPRGPAQLSTNIKQKCELHYALAIAIVTTDDRAA